MTSAPVQQETERKIKVQPDIQKDRNKETERKKKMEGFAVL